MCQVTSFNLDHERCIEGCNCCKSKQSAASVSATLAERERIIKLLKEQGVIRNCSATNKLVFVHCNSMEVLYLKDLDPVAPQPVVMTTNHSLDCSDPTCIECEDVCEYCDNTGMADYQVDVDAFKKVPCMCWRGKE